MGVTERVSGGGGGGAIKGLVPTKEKIVNSGLHAGSKLAPSSQHETFFPDDLSPDSLDKLGTLSSLDSRSMRPESAMRGTESICIGEHDRLAELEKALRYLSS